MGQSALLMSMKRLLYFLFCSLLTATDSDPSSGWKGRDSKNNNYKKNSEASIFGLGLNLQSSASTTEKSSHIDTLDEMGFFLPFKDLPEIPSTYRAYTEYQQPQQEAKQESYEGYEQEAKQESYKGYEQEARQDSYMGFGQEQETKEDKTRFT